MGPVQGAIRREWQALYKDCNAADGRLSPCPQEGPQIAQSRVAVLDKGMAIARELRLVLSKLWASENVKQYETLH